MKNLIWILGGVAVGYYLAKKPMQVPTNGSMRLPGGTAIPNTGLAPAPGVGACPGARIGPYRYVNCNSLAEAKMTF
ncbi:MAG: hypothetical protein K9I85_06005 [Saprospiraceae bacterium]|nr:hypothetical protein [Saprospiraceae bacterium]